MKATHPQPHKTDKHPCSPFFACGTCHGFVVPGFDLLLPGRQPEPVLQRAVYKSQPLPDFHTSIWQPPRSIMA